LIDDEYISDVWNFWTTPPHREHCSVRRRKMGHAQIFMTLFRGGWDYQLPPEMVFQRRLMPPAAPENSAHFQRRLEASAAPRNPIFRGG